MTDRLAENQDHVRTLWRRVLDAADRKDWPEADRLFNETRLFAKTNDMRFFELHVHYAAHLIASGGFEQSLPHLRFLRDLHAQLGVTDYSFLGLRGVPPFEDYLGLAKAFLNADAANMAHLDLLEGLAGTLDPEGDAAVRAALASLGAGEREPGD